MTLPMTPDKLNELAEREDQVVREDDLVAPFYQILMDFPADGQLRSLDRDMLTNLIVAGFIERHEVEKPCRTCGKPQFDYGYFRITDGGKVFMAACRATSLKARASIKEQERG